MGTKATASLTLAAATRSLEESEINTSLPYQIQKTKQHKDGLGCLKSLEGIKTKWDTHRGGDHPLGLWTPARSLPEKLGSQVTPGEGRTFGP